VLPEQVRLRPEGAGDLRRFTGSLQETRGLCIKLQQDRHHASHSKADTAFHSLSWHAAVLRLAEMPAELQSSAQMFLATAMTIPAPVQAGLEQALQVLAGIETQPLLAHVERSFVQLAGERTGLAERWLAIHPPAPDAGPALQAEDLSQLREEVAILQDRFAALSGSIGPVLNRLSDDIEGRADSKSQQASGWGCRRAMASSIVMSCITICKPARIDRNPARRNRFMAAVRSVAITPAPLPR